MDSAVTVAAFVIFPGICYSSSYSYYYFLVRVEGKEEKNAVVVVPIAGYVCGAVE